MVPAISLRRIDADRDAEQLAAFHTRNREFMAAFEPDRPPEYFTPDGLRARIHAAHAEAGDSLVDWAIWYDDQLVGKIALSRIARGPFQSAGLGYAVDLQFNGRGIATEAVRLALTEAFDGLALHRVEAGTLLTNLASQRVLEKNGFLRIGVSLRYLKIAGEWRDHVLYAVTAD